MTEGETPRIEDPGAVRDSGAESIRLPEEFLAGDTVAGLERLRTRLLDLTGKNRLLNFRHPGRSCLRVVGCPPDEIFGRLLRGQKLFFKPVPEPRREDYVPDHQKPTAVEYAARLNVPTSYELPDSPGDSSAHHGQSLQTLLYASDLDTLARRLGNSARTSIEESGTNMLYLALGFPEWFDAEDSDELRHAPLLVIPTNLVREKSTQGGAVRNCLEYTGEDLAINLCLVEKLRQDFSLELPTWEEEDTPEVYFSRVQRILVHTPQWKLRKWGTVCLLYFGKLLMYLDLNPKRWPSGHELHKHSTIVELFEGLKGGPTNPADEYDIDSPSLSHQLPEIIFDADSSQHSALIDAIGGKNLVIEGPPGTGKSQTITNLIAASLVRGKTVLFVSEKLAALEVVRRRLDEAGLGIFCLELHSHKTQKQQLLKELQERLKLRRQFAQPEELEHKLKILQKNKQTLIEYVSLINSKFGNLSHTLFDIIWAREGLRRKVRFDLRLVEEIVLDKPDLLSPTEFEMRRQELEIYARHAASILRSYSSIQAHPWCGVSNSEMTYSDEQQLLGLLQRITESGSAVEALLREFSHVIGVASEHSLAVVYAFCDLQNELPRPTGTEISALLPQLRLKKVREVIKGFVNEIDSYRHEMQELKPSFDSLPHLDEQLRNRLASAVERASQLSLTERDTPSLRELASLLDGVIARVKRATVCVREILTIFDYKGPQSIRAVQFILAALDLLSSGTPFELLRLRLPALEEETATACIHAAADEAGELREVRRVLRLEFAFERITSAEELRKTAQVLETATMWQRLFSKECRASRRLFRYLSLAKRRADHLLMASRLRQLVSFLERDAKFRSENVCRTILGTHFKGIDTRWEDFKRLLTWYQEVYRQIPLGEPVAAGMLRALFSTRTERLQEALRFSQRNPNGIEDLRGLPSELSNLVGLFPTALENSSEEDISILAEKLVALRQDIQFFIDALAGGGIANGTNLGAVPALIEKLDHLNDRKRDLNEKSAARDILKEHFRGVETDIAPLGATLKYAELISESHSPESLKEWLLDENAFDRLPGFTNWCEQLGRSARLFADLWKEIETLAGLDRRGWFAEKAAQEIDLSVEEITARAKRALEHRTELPIWLDYLRARGEIRPAKLEKLVFLVENCRLEPDDLIDGFQYVVYNSLVRRALESKPLLMQFNGLTHAKLRTDFARLDEEIIHLHRLRAAHVIDRRPFHEGVRTGPVNHWTDGALIVHEISKQSRHIPIRQLVKRSAQALLALKPCFMMGPLSVAQYLGPGEIHFDLVVMDEASQLKPEDAMGAIARGGQVVVVGDPKQLPPSSFFERGLSEDNLEDPDITAAEEGESILDVATSIYQPPRRLRWHYRSRHHSLIAFSNQQFYGDLVVFPSAYVSAPDLGVRFIPIEDGIYESRRNPVEAERIARAVLEHMVHHPKESLGVATLNFEQYELIDELLDKKFQNDPHARSYLEKWEQEAEPFFVKNLENVQGDERDVVFISMTYGRDARGNFYQRFGPINGRMGHRRLNVLFTRAKKRTVVFSSMDPGMIKEEGNSPRGLKVLKAYLSYAKTGVLEQPKGSSGPSESNFEVAVGHALRERGYEFVPQVGVAGFFVDLAVQHPRNPGSFILGVECDGASYHSGRSARDRDRLRQMILENLGWNIHRIWSTDWFKNRDREVEKLDGHISGLLLKEESEAASRQALEAIFSSDYGATVPEEGSPTTVDAPRQLALFELRKKEVRRQLLDLRDKAMKAEFPEVSAERNLLRDEMMDLFLQKLPTTKTEWFNKVPLRLRQGSDLLQMRKYLPQILEILSQLAD